MACPKCGNTTVSFFDPCPRCGNGDGAPSGTPPAPAAGAPTGEAEDERPSARTRVHLSLAAWCIATAIYIAGNAMGDGRHPAPGTFRLTALALAGAWWAFWRPAKQAWGWGALLALPLALVPCLPLFPLVLWRLTVAGRPVGRTRS